MNVISIPRRGVKRSRFGSRRPRMAVQRIPRTLRYNGENKITRVVTCNLNYGPTGFSLASSFYQAINIVFDPTSVTFYGNTTVFASFPIPNAAELSALYDQLRIDKVEITWSSNAQATTGATGSTITCPKFLICNDSNDGIGTATLSQIQQQPNKEYYAVDGRSHKWTCRPKYQRVIFQTALVSNYEPTTGFVNANSTIPHYGSKLAISNLDSIPTTGGFIDFSVKFFLTLKNVK